MIRFLHVADIHFGVENYGKIDQTTGMHTRLLDFARALHFCIDAAIEQNVDFFLFAGDAYKTHNPTQTQQKLLLECFLRLHEAHIPAVLIVGNHDIPVTFGKIHALDIFKQLPLRSFHVIAKPTSFLLSTKSGPVQIVGIPWPSKSTVSLAQQHSTSFEATDYISSRLASLISHYAQQLDTKIPAVLAGHLTVSSGIFSGSERSAIHGLDPILLPSQLALEPFDYVALGHLHRHQQLSSSSIPIVYAGSIERIDFGERADTKGCCLVSIAQKGGTQYEFIKTPTRNFVQIDHVLLDNGISLTDQLIARIKQEQIENAIVKIIYRVPETTSDTIDFTQVQRACASAHDLATVIPVFQETKRQRRTSQIQEGMSLELLLKLYFENKQEYRTQSNQLVMQSLLLAQELASEEDQLR
jgi:exonuclease SbcD